MVERECDQRLPGLSRRSLSKAGPQGSGKIPKLYEFDSAFYQNIIRAVKCGPRPMVAGKVLLRSAQDMTCSDSEILAITYAKAMALCSHRTRRNGQ